MRLDKLLEENKVGSRKKIKQTLLTGQVKVNEEIVRVGSYSVDPGLDLICVEGEEILQGNPHRYYMLNKPQGVVSAVSDAKHATVLNGLGDAGIDTRGLFPVGRLDRDTEGLIFLTDNGHLAYQLAMGDKHVVKTYLVKVNKELTTADQQAFKEGIVFFDGTNCRPAELTILSSNVTESLAQVSISEGKFHQVKKMFLTVNCKVEYLKRLSIGPLILDEQLALGEFRMLTEMELNKLKTFFNNPK